MTSAEVQALIEEARRLPYDPARLVPRLADALEAEKARSDTLFEELDEANVKLAWERAAHEALRQQVEKVLALHKPETILTVGGSDVMCAECRKRPKNAYDVVWPCATARLLAQDNQEES